MKLLFFLCVCHLFVYDSTPCGDINILNPVITPNHAHSKILQMQISAINVKPSHNKTRAALLQNLNSVLSHNLTTIKSLQLCAYEQTNFPRVTSYFHLPCGMQPRLGKKHVLQLTYTCSMHSCTRKMDPLLSFQYYTICLRFKSPFLND